MSENKSMQEIREVNAHIKQGIKMWSEVCLMADADEWAFYLDYADEDVMNAALIFQHVCMNVGIKSGKIGDREAAEIGERLRQLIIDMTGIDPRTYWREKKEAGT